MSSSRSIAAARNRRAGVDVPHKLQAGRSMNTISQPPMQPHQHIQQQNIGQKSNGLPFSKLTISDAIGLITLRLGKVEQHLIEQQNNPIISKGETPSVDNTLLTTLTRRLDEMEKKEKLVNLNDFKAELASLTQNINSIQKQFEEFKTETQNKFIDYETAMCDIESKIFIEDNDISPKTSDEPKSEVVDSTDSKNKEVSVYVKETGKKEEIVDTETHNAENAENAENVENVENSENVENDENAEEDGFEEVTGNKEKKKNRKKKMSLPI